MGIVDKNGRPMARERAGIAQLERRSGGAATGFGRESDRDGAKALRRWEAADTNRLNQAHWSGAQSWDINADLWADRETIVTRVRYEIANNTLLQGMVGTYLTDLIGRRGPQLQVQSSNENYNRQAERLWNRWWRQPDMAGKLSGRRMLQLLARGLFTDGEFLVRALSTERAERMRPRLRLQAVHPDRLGVLFSAGQQRQDTDIILGVERDRWERPVAYHLQETRGGIWSRFLNRVERVAAENVIHVYDVLEAGQARGMPRLAAALPDLAALRDYQEEVLEATRTAAHHTVLLTAATEVGEYLDLQDQLAIERGMMESLPPGWQANQLKPEQPQANYVDYVKERQGDAARGIRMPLIKARRDASDSNYSSARFDALDYNDVIDDDRVMFEETTLEPMVEWWLREVELMELLPARPNDATYTWVWPGKKHVDPAKESKGLETLLKNHLTSLKQQLAEKGIDWKEHLQQLSKEREQLAALGLSADAVAGSAAGDGGGSGGSRMGAEDVRAIVEEVIAEGAEA